MRSLALVPAALTLFLATAAILLAGTAQAVQWLPWFRRGSADLRADQLFLAVLCPLLASGVITLFVMATLVDDLLAFHQMPHLCLDPSALSATGRFAVFAMEGGTLLALAVMGCQMVRAIWLLRHTGARSRQQLGLSDRAAAAGRACAHLECTAEFHEADLPRPPPVLSAPAAVHHALAGRAAFAGGVAPPRTKRRTCIVGTISPSC